MQHVNPAATSLIKRMLNADPALRPTVAELQTDEFFTGGYCPVRLPTTCLTVPPRFSIAPSQELGLRRPLTALDNKGINAIFNRPKGPYRVLNEYCTSGVMVMCRMRPIVLTTVI